MYKFITLMYMNVHDHFAIQYILYEHYFLAKYSFTNIKFKKILLEKFPYIHILYMA